MIWLLISFGILFAVGLWIYAFFIEPFSIRVIRKEIILPQLPDTLDGFSICHLSDTHTSDFGKLERRLKDHLASMEVDLCVITGDILRSKSGISAIGKVIDSISSRFGIWAVPGNGDYKFKLTADELSAKLQPLGIRMLINDSHALREDLQIIGVDDPFRKLDDLPKALEGMTGDGFRLLLAHSPDILRKMNGDEVDLILAGHTHGGQIRLPWVGALWLHSRYNIPISDGHYAPRELSDIFSKNVKAHMYVSRGIGGSGVTARFLCPPEIVILTLRREVSPA